MTRSTRLATLAALLGLLAGCMGQDIRGQAEGVADIIKNARKNGAYYCAPKELALAEAYLQRTTDELDIGNYVPAKDHIGLADKNARLAFKNSPPEKCVPKVVLPTPKIGDRDGDGCLDDVDKCPDEPEDKDGFQDDDCCPDPDNDQDGITDVADICPNEPEDKDGYQDADGCPDPDNDRDGIVDATDRCPNEPEDRDGFQDADGCPDADNDADRIADIVDMCPLQPEDYDGDNDTDGCPDLYKLVVVTDKKIELKQKVFFATAKSRILARSFPLLNEVAKVLKDRPKINVRIEGHTDSRGSDRYNMKLSDRRAKSVRRYLMQQGIGGERMVAQGYGESRPIASNRTRAGRAMNRRVEFFITSQ
jgi:outer membrane protein OmpA-like peptidoglycan-associated protein